MNKKTRILAVALGFAAVLPALCKAELIDASQHPNVDAAFNAFLLSSTATGIYFPARTSSYVIESPPLSFGGHPKSITLKGDSTSHYTPGTNGGLSDGSRIRVNGTSGPGFSLSFSSFSQTFTMDGLELHTDYEPANQPRISGGGIKVDYSAATGTASGGTVNISRSRFNFPYVNPSSAMVSLVRVHNGTVTTTMFHGGDPQFSETNGATALKLGNDCNNVWVTKCSTTHCKTGVDVDSSSGSLYAIYVVHCTYVGVGCGLKAHGYYGGSYLTFSMSHVDLRVPASSAVTVSKWNAVFIESNFVGFNGGSKIFPESPRFALIHVDLSSGVSMCDNLIVGTSEVAAAALGNGDYIRATSLSSSYILRNVFANSGTFYSDSILPCYGNRIDGLVIKDSPFKPSPTKNIIGEDSPYSY